MTVADQETASNAAAPEPEATTSRVVRVLEDPFGSMYVGLLSTGLAVAVVFSGILGLSMIH
jgi:hypothetical protein